MRGERLPGKKKRGKDREGAGKKKGQRVGTDTAQATVALNDKD